VSRFVLLLALLLVTGAAPAHAQRRAPVSVLLPANGAVAASAGAEGPRVVTARVLEDARTRELLRSGFPARLRYRLELWREGGWFDDLERTASWDVIVAFDPATQLYRVRRLDGSQVEDLGSFNTVAGAQAVIERPQRVNVIPSRAGRRYYYNLVLEIESLSVSDLDQLERWLRGELEPAVRGRNNPATAVGTGVRTLVTRILGGERRSFQVRSASFRT
jgi:hypothetical protein